MLTTIKEKKLNLFVTANHKNHSILVCVEETREGLRVIDYVVPRDGIIDCFKEILKKIALTPQDYKISLLYSPAFKRIIQAAKSQDFQDKNPIIKRINYEFCVELNFDAISAKNVSYFWASKLVKTNIKFQEKICSQTINPSAMFEDVFVEVLAMIAKEFERWDELPLIWHTPNYNNLK